MFLFWTNYKLWKKYPSNDFEDNAPDQDPDYNAALEDLKKSKEANDGRFSSKLKFWQTSNKAKLSTETEKHNVGIFSIYFLNQQTYRYHCFRINTIKSNLQITGFVNLRM